MRYALITWADGTVELVTGPCLDIDLYVWIAERTDIRRIEIGYRKVSR